MTGGRVDLHVEVTAPTVGLVPPGSQPGSRFVVDHAQVEAVSVDEQGCGAGSLRQLDGLGRRQDALPAGLTGDQVDPVDVGEAEVVDVRVHRRHHEVAGQDGPVVPSLVHSEAAVEVRPVQRLARPPLPLGSATNHPRHRGLPGRPIRAGTRGHRPVLAGRQDVAEVGGCGACRGRPLRIVRVSAQSNGVTHGEAQCANASRACRPDSGLDRYAGQRGAIRQHDRQCRPGVVRAAWVQRTVDPRRWCCDRMQWMRREVGGDGIRDRGGAPIRGCIRSRRHGHGDCGEVSAVQSGRHRRTRVRAVSLRHGCRRLGCTWRDGGRPSPCRPVVVRRQWRRGARAPRADATRANPTSQTDDGHRLPSPASGSRADRLPRASASTSSAPAISDSSRSPLSTTTSRSGRCSVSARCTSCVAASYPISGFGAAATAGLASANARQRSRSASMPSTHRVPKSAAALPSSEIAARRLSAMTGR